LKRVTAALIVTSLSLFWIGEAAAHSMRESNVAIDIGASSISVESEWPLEELELALRSPLNATGNSLTKAQQRLLSDYGSRHIWIEQLDGERWPRETDNVRFEQRDGHNQIIYRAVYRPSRAINVPAVRLHYDAITHEVMSHVALIYRQIHARPAVLEQSANPFAVIQNPATGIELELANQDTLGMATNLTVALAAALIAAIILTALMLWKRRKSAIITTSNETKSEVK
jgi:hypothetical protein